MSSPLDLVEGNSIVVLSGTCYFRQPGKKRYPMVGDLSCQKFSLGGYLFSSMYREAKNFESGGTLQIYT